MQNILQAVFIDTKQTLQSEINTQTDENTNLLFFLFYIIIQIVIFISLLHGHIRTSETDNKPLTKQDTKTLSRSTFLKIITHPRPLQEQVLFIVAIVPQLWRTVKGQFFQISETASFLHAYLSGVIKLPPCFSPSALSYTPRAKMLHFSFISLFSHGLPFSENTAVKKREEGFFF